MRIPVSMLALAAAVLSPPAAAQFMPGPADFGSAQDTEIALQSVEAISTHGKTPAEILAALDLLLARAAGPGRARGMVQMHRGAVLENLKRVPEAIAAADESVRLLPGYSGPLLLATQLHAYGDRPELAVDFLVRASRIDPERVRRYPSHEIRNLLHRLRMKGDDSRVTLLSQRLIDVGWRGDDLGSRSELVRELIEHRVEIGSLAEARALVPELLNPADMYRLLTLQRMQPVWPEVEAWAGPQLEKQWPVYLREARERVDAGSGDLVAARDYLTALNLAEQHSTIANELLPLFTGELHPLRSYDLLWMAAPITGALAHLGRLDEGEAILDRMLKVWPLGSDVNALNLSGNKARLLLRRGRTEDALRMMDATISEAEKDQAMVGIAALAAMHQVRVCALHLLGRSAEAGRSLAIGAAGSLLSPTGRATMYLCLERPEEARRGLIQALADPRTRDTVVAFLQPTPRRPTHSPYDARVESGLAALRVDKVLRAAAAEHARILDFTLSAGAPEEVMRSMP